MKTMVPRKLEEGRWREGRMASDASFGMAGMFSIRGPSGWPLKIVSSGPDQESGWEHVSVSLANRCPTWEEMCFVKDLFWHDDEVVLQFHPAKRNYVNHHPFVLHLWRPVDGVVPMPPLWTV